MATSSARRNINMSIANDNADFVKRNGVNLSKAVDRLIIEMRRVKMREEWTIENQAALSERSEMLESEGGTAAERLYGVLRSNFHIQANSIPPVCLTCLPSQNAN